GSVTATPPEVRLGRPLVSVLRLNVSGASAPELNSGATLPVATVASPATSPVPPAMPPGTPSSSTVPVCCAVLAVGVSSSTVTTRALAAAEVGGPEDRAEVDRQVVLGVVAGQAVEGRVVELVLQREGPGAGGAVELEGEHLGGAGRGGQLVARPRVGDGLAAGGQAGQA